MIDPGDRVAHGREPRRYPSDIDIDCAKCGFAIVCNSEAQRYKRIVCLNCTRVNDIPAHLISTAFGGTRQVA